MGRRQAYVLRTMARRRAAKRGHARSRARLVLVGVGTLAFAAAAFVFVRPGAPAAPAGASVAYAAPVRGDPAAPVTIVEYGDFQCPSCGAFTRSVEPELIRRYVDTGKAKIEFHHFPWIGPESKRAAEAASCAGAQGRFWEYHDLLYAQQRGENSGFLTAVTLKRFATQLALDQAAFDRCLDDGTFRAAVEADLSEVRRLGLNGTPTFVINGQRVVGAQPIGVFATVIEAKLAGR